MNHKAIFLICLFLTQSVSLFSQNNQDGKVSGTIIDQETKEGIAFANIMLYSATDSVMVAATVTNEKGRFSISKIPYDQYLLKISCVGYQKKSLKIEVGKNPQILSPERAALAPADIKLDDITVKGDRGSTQIFINKEVVVPDTSMLKSSANALEVLAKIPGLKVDRLNNSATILGKENVLLLINGIEREGGVNLNTIKPDEIDKIEIIQAPSSKYDSEYTGAINIVLKRKPPKGFSVDLDLNYYGTRHNESFAQLQYGMKNLRIFGNYSYYLRNHLFETSEQRNNNTYSYEKESKQLKNKENGHFFQFGGDYFINSNNTLNFTGDYKTIDMNKNGVSSTDLSEQGVNRSFSSAYFPTGKIVMQNYSVYYEHNFKDPSTRITTDFNYYNYRLDNQVDFFYTFFKDDLSLDYQSQSSRQERFNKKSYNYKIDFSTLLFKSMSVEAGYNFYRRDFKNYFTQNNLSEEFIFAEDRNSVYTNLTYKFHKLSFYSGIRMEYTYTLINNRINNNYFHFVPGFGISWSQNGTSNFQLNYRKKLTRPEIELLNPFVYRQDSLNSNSGNPTLNPAINHNIEFRHLLKKNGFYLSPSIYYSWSRDIIGKRIRLSGNSKFTQIDNIAQSESKGFQLHATFTLFKIIKLNPFFHFYSKSVSDGNIKNSGNSFTASLFTEIKLPWNTSVGVDLSLPGKEYYLQGFYQNNFRIDYLYGNMNILKGKGMLMAGIINPFSILTTETREVWDNTQLFTKNRMDNQMFFIKFSYSFNVGPAIKTLQRTYNMERDK